MEFSIQPRNEPEGEEITYNTEYKPYHGWMEGEMEPEQDTFVQNSYLLRYSETKKINTSVYSLSEISDTRYDITAEDHCLDTEAREDSTNFDCSGDLFADNTITSIMKPGHNESSEFSYEDSAMTLIIDNTEDFVTSKGGICQEDDNQCVPECENFEEQEILTREVEGCEFPDSYIEELQHRKCSTSMKNRGKSSFNPRASSTFTGELPVSTKIFSSKNKSRKTNPCFSSTMIIEEDTKEMEQIVNSVNSADLNSIYTWSIHDSHDQTFEESYMQGHHLIVRPPITKKKNVNSKNSDEDFCIVKETLSDCCDSIMDSLYDDDEDVCMVTRIPESLSRANSDSSLESVLCNAELSDNVFYSTMNDFHQVPNLSEESDENVNYSSDLQIQAPQPSKSSKRLKIISKFHLKKLFNFKKSLDKKLKNGKACDQDIVKTQGQCVDSERFVHTDRRNTLMTTCKRFRKN